MTTLSTRCHNGSAAAQAKPNRYDGKCDYCGGAVKAFEGVLVYGDRRRWVPAHRSGGCHECVIRSYNGSTVKPKVRMWRDEVNRWYDTLEYQAWSRQREELRRRRADALDGRPCEELSEQELQELFVSDAIGIACCQIGDLVRRDEFPGDPKKVVAALTPIPGPDFDLGSFCLEVFGDARPAWIFGDPEARSSKDSGLDR